LTYAACAFVGDALFPRLAYRLRWPTRARGTLLLAYIAWNTALGFWFRHRLAPIFREAAKDQQVATQQLRAELGREPTREELGERLAHMHGWDSSPLMPRPDAD
jgi:hypothetical protein